MGLLKRAYDEGSRHESERLPAARPRNFGRQVSLEECGGVFGAGEDFFERRIVWMGGEIRCVVVGPLFGFGIFAIIAVAGIGHVRTLTCGQTLISLCSPWSHKRHGIETPLPPII